jgi:hypothetical protein
LGAGFSQSAFAGSGVPQCDTVQPALRICFFIELRWDCNRGIKALLEAGRHDSVNITLLLYGMDIVQGAGLEVVSASTIRARYDGALLLSGVAADRSEGGKNEAIRLQAGFTRSTPLGAPSLSATPATPVPRMYSFTKPCEDNNEGIKTPS